MAEALAEQVDSLTLLTSGGLLPSQVPEINLANWYGVRCDFPIIRLPIYRRLNQPLFEDWQYPRFDKVAALYARVRSPNVVFTRSLKAGYLCVKLKLNTIIETHIEKEYFEFQRLASISHSHNFLGVVTVTDYLKDSYIEAGIPASKILMWPDAVDLTKFTNLPSPQILRNQLKLPATKKIATYCGHLYEQKGVSHVISAAKHLPDVFFCLVGGWPQDIERCREHAKGLENVHFVGFISNDQVPKYLAVSDFLLLPNSLKFKHAYATSPLKLFEYMAARRPIIASNIPALKGLLRHQENAFLVEPDSSIEIASAIQALIENPDLSSRIVEQAWQDVQQFTWSQRAKDIVNYFKVNK